MKFARVSVALAAAAAMTMALGACSTPSRTAQLADVNDPAAAIVALCDQIVTNSMSPADADALAVSSGYTSRIGSVDGEGQALTMDYRMDRMTFDVEGDVVTRCTVG